MSQLSPLDYAVISQALIAAAREMGVKLIRSAYSTILREARDGSAGLMDRHGNTVAQAELIPMQLGPIGETLRACLRRHPVETLKEGDFLINNDPFEGGQHIPDVFIFTPIFVGGRVVGFGASVAHHLDLGGGAPGLNIHASDVYQEGLRFPPSKYDFARDWNGGSFERLVTANVRVPDLTIGDFNAQFAASLGNLVNNGIPLLNALKLTAKSTANVFLRGLLNQAAGIIGEGVSLSSALRKVGHLPVLLVDMVAMGEQTGRLGKSLEKIAARYDKELDGRVKRVTALITPIVLVILFVVVGVVAISIVTAIFETMTSVRARS